jgi:hypothetical protein
VCSHDEVRFDLETRASPDQVRRALTDFSDRRLRTWHRTLDPKTYEVLDQGEQWAVARESTAGSPAWTVARYDWSDPDVVRWRVTESSYGGGGDGFVRITPREGGRSSVHAEWAAVDARRQKLLLFVIHHGPMRMLISRLWLSALDGFASEDTS